jgi:hypothetical protein
MLPICMRPVLMKKPHTYISHCLDRLCARQSLELLFAKKNGNIPAVEAD